MIKKRKFGPTDAQIDAAEEAVAALEQTVKFIVTDYTVEHLAGKVANGEYYVPSYQREFVWSPVEQSRFIESVLMGLPIPFVFLWQDPDGRLEIVDGSQRLRTLEAFVAGSLKLQKLELLEALNGFSYANLTKSRQRKFDARVIRGIVLDTAVTAGTRTEMFNRINTGGQKANDAEVRRGSLPGPFTDVVIQCGELPAFIEMTPIAAKQIREREREELAVRFFTYLNSLRVSNGVLELPNWKDRPADYIFDFVADENSRCTDDPERPVRHLEEFQQMLAFVDEHFPNGFRKSLTGTQIPRVRFEAISVGVGLALRSGGDIDVGDMTWITGEEFGEITATDGANVRAKVLGRITFVLKKLMKDERIPDALQGTQV